MLIVPVMGAAVRVPPLRSGYEVWQSSPPRFVRALEDRALQELPSHRASRPHRQDPRSCTTVDQGVQSAKVRMQRVWYRVQKLGYRR